MKQFRPVSTRRAFEEITAQIRERLANGALQVGDRLPAERVLAQQFSVSRNTVREGLRSLEMSGLLQFKKGVTGGAFVCENGGNAVIAGLSDLYNLGTIRPKDLTEARIVIGTEVARLASARRTRADLAALQKNVADAEAATAAGEMARRAELNYDFHRILARATKNPVLIILTDAVLEMTRQFIQKIGFRPNRYVLPSRRRMLEYLREGDANAMAREMESSLRSLQRAHLSHFKSSTSRT